MKEQEEFSIEDLCRLVVWAIGANKSKTELAVTLSGLGFSTGKIARLLGVESKMASALLSNAKKTKKK